MYLILKPLSVIQRSFTVVWRNRRKTIRLSAIEDMSLSQTRTPAQNIYSLCLNYNICSGAHASRVASGKRERVRLFHGGNNIWPGSLRIWPPGIHDIQLHVMATNSPPPLQWLDQLQASVICKRSAYANGSPQPLPALNLYLNEVFPESGPGEGERHRESIQRCVGLSVIVTHPMCVHLWISGG